MTDEPTRDEKLQVFKPEGHPIWTASFPPPHVTATSWCLQAWANYVDHTGRWVRKNQEGGEA